MNELDNTLHLTGSVEQFCFSHWLFVLSSHQKLRRDNDRNYHTSLEVLSLQNGVKRSLSPSQEVGTCPLWLGSQPL
ncbi:hypothetical protein JZ751_005578 [Albula glossodonta]|uniref:Uncharacterized protein n=1 Tax=Albula glossodonta TaxID=121402 RepID=A0A8T2N4R8_9TELE|nr:hypothetical protein JZ751_005578 [Albula glossodonta]